MLNDRDPNEQAPKSEEGESEYHFSDEDVSYELEDEEASTEQQQAAVPSQSFKEKLLTRLNTSRRMIITLVVFLILIFAVYKMVSPTSSKAPSIDIKPAVVSNQPPQPIGKAPLQVASAPNAPTVNQPSTMQPSSPPPTTMQTSPVAQTPAVPSSVPMQPVAQQQQPQIVPVAPPSPPPTTQQPVQPVVGMPQMIPVQPQIASVANQQPQMVTVPTTGMSPESAKLISDLQTEYMQRLNDFAAQNKNIGDEVQLLNSRVASLEAQINQLTEQLTQKARQASLKEEHVGPTIRQQPLGGETASPHVSYSVQAIIPGRAWLRADNGETVTVTEGDVIRDLGRITKIDPYDGVVEVNTGTKVVSISYGTGT